MEEKNQWYTNKDLYEMIQKLMNQMGRTEQIIGKYNGLHERLQEHEKRLNTIDNRGDGKKSVEAAILRWLPAVVALIALAVSAL